MTPVHRSCITSGPAVPENMGSTVIYALGYTKVVGPIDSIDSKSRVERIVTMIDVIEPR